MIQRAIGPTAKVLAAARHTGVKILYLKMGFRHDLSDLGPSDSPNRMRHMLVGVGDGLGAHLAPLVGDRRRAVGRDTP